MMGILPFLAVVLLGLLGPSCEQEETAFAIPPLSLRVSSDPEWTGATKDDEVVAFVNGIPVPLGRLRRALEEAKAPSDPQEVLRLILAEEALAQQAVSRPNFDEGALRDFFLRVMVARLINERYLEAFSVEGVSQEELEEFWKIPSVRGRFDHLTIFQVQDFQWICCDGSPVNCSTREAQECFVEGQIAIEATKVFFDRILPVSEDLPLYLQDLKASAPRLAYQEYSFAYDERKRLQKGRTIFDDAVVEAVVSTPKGSFAKSPVRSNFGWHLPFVKDIVPEEHRGLEDPSVRQELAQSLRLRIIQRRFLRDLSALIPVETFLYFGPLFRDFKRKERPQLHVTLFPEALSEWREAKTEIEGL